MATADELLALAHRLDQAARGHRLQLPLAGTGGAWREAALRRQEAINDEAARIDASLADAAAILYSAAHAWQLIGPALADMGAELDAACAQALLRVLCTPLHEPAPGHANLGSFSGMSSSDIDSRNRAMLSNAAQHLLPHLGADDDVFVLEASDTTAAVSIGDIDTAPAVVTMVGGVGSSDPARWPGALARARHLQQATGAAVIVWQGYQAPPTIAHGIAQQPAQHAGQTLRTFQQHLRQRTTVPLHVVAHSYGSVVAGNAAHAGLDADTLILLGSPGAAHRDVTLTGHDGTPGKVHSLLGRNDPIGVVTGIHGPLPTPRFDHSTAGDHSDYFSDDTLIKLLRTTQQQPHSDTREVPS